jgi:hypothetical protein
MFRRMYLHVLLPVPVSKFRANSSVVDPNSERYGGLEQCFVYMRSFLEYRHESSENHIRDAPDIEAELQKLCRQPVPVLCLRKVNFVIDAYFKISH